MKQRKQNGSWDPDVVDLDTLLPKEHLLQQCPSAGRPCLCGEKQQKKNSRRCFLFYDTDKRLTGLSAAPDCRILFDDTEIKVSVNTVRHNQVPTDFSRLHRICLPVN